LANATNSLNEKSFETASNSIAEAETLINSLTSFLSNFAAELTTQRIATYIEQAEERLSAIKERAVSVSNAASLTALNQAQHSLSNARGFLEKRLINETVNELMNSKQSEVQAVEYLKPTSISTDSTTNNGLSTVHPP
jgi:sensor histidine kinase regulating citrate/malate metabolism